MDDSGYVVDNGTKNLLVTTNHGRLTEMSAGYFLHKIKEYEDVIKDTKEAIELFENGRN